jgi:dsDNA-specific endonuclease/ATPase MutS2
VKKDKGPTTPDSENRPDFEAPVVVPVEDSIDLHTFRPAEVRDLLDDYLEAAREKGFEEVKIIHGKGTGALRAMVQSILRKHPLVLSFREADAPGSGWGATVARLRAADPNG